jgi:hypothetical protein
MAMVSVWSAFLSVTSRPRTTLRTHPAWASPGRKRTIFWLVRSRKTAMASLSLTTAPISASGGRSGPAGGGGGAAAGSTGGAATALGGGRREAEKTGRSRVGDSAESGIDHSGFPLGNGLAASRGGWLSGLTGLTSTLVVSSARSLDRISGVADVAAWSSGQTPIEVAAPTSSAKAEAASFEGSFKINVPRLSG